MLEEKKFLFELNNKEKISKIVVQSFEKKTNSYELLLPGSKSFSNRAIVLAGMNPLPTKIKGILFSDDSYWGLNSLEKLGFKLEIDYTNAEVTIIPPAVKFLQKVDLYFGKAGTLARFFPAVLLNWQRTFHKSSQLIANINADPQLIRRPITPLIYALNQLGANIQDSQLPTILKSCLLQGECEISGNISGQFLSGLLLAAAGSKSKCKIKRIENLVQPDYVKMTIAAIEKFGVQVNYDHELTAFEIQNKDGFQFNDYTVEADASTSCYFVALAFLHNFDLKIMNLGSNTLQPDYKFMHILQMLGANIEIYPDKTIVNKRPVNLKPKGNFEFDFSFLSDQALTLGVIGLFADSPITVKGVAHIRHHESDRISCFVKNVRELGLKIEEFPDGFTIYPIENTSLVGKGCFATWEDHRFAMSGFILCSLLNSVTLLNPKCVEKTAPKFFQQMQSIGFNIIESSGD